LDKVLPALHASTVAPDSFDLASVLEDSQAEEPDDHSFESHGSDGGANAGFGDELSERAVADGKSGAPKGAVRKNFSAALAGGKSLLTTTSPPGGMEMPP